MYRALPKNHQTPEVDSQFFTDGKASFHACNLIEAAPGVHSGQSKCLLVVSRHHGQLKTRQPALSQFGEPFMKLKLVAAISALAAIASLAHAQQGGPQPKIPKPTTADAQNVVQIITSDKVKTQAYCDLTKLEGQVEAAAQKNDAKTLEALNKQANALLDKLGPEYFKLMDGLEQVDPKSSEAKEFMSILSELDKSCTN